MKTDRDSRSPQLRIKEAEIYRAQGLYREALEIYERLAAEAGDQTPLKDEIATAIGLLQVEIKRVEQDDSSLSAEDVSFLRSSWEGATSVAEILDSAAAFTELGLHKEAIDEYAKLIGMDHPQDDVVHRLMASLLAIHSPSPAIEHLQRLLDDKRMAAADRAALLFAAGTEMEAAGFRDLSLGLYEQVREISPDFQGLKAIIEALQKDRTYDSRYGYLIDSAKVTASQLQDALAAAKKAKKSVEHILIERFNIAKEEIGKSLSLFYKVPFKAFSQDMPVPAELFTKLKKPFLLQNNWVPLGWEMSAKSVDILIDDPKDLSRIDPIPSLFNIKKINFFVGIAEDITAAITHFFEAKDKADKAAGLDEEQTDRYDVIPDIEFEEDEDRGDEIHEEIDEASGQIVKLVDHILISAYRKGASDIHIEPSVITKSTMVRYRVDGVCQEVLQVPNTHAKALLSRLKIMSGLDIAERRLPQDGKIKFKRKGIKAFELRLATLPTAGGLEDAVLRILAESGAMALDDMGMNERNLSIMKKIVAQPYGLILVVGPTGSGKTTTLHAALGYINKPGIKIWTAEDPVEITQKGLRQVECKPKIGLDFARVMRAFLRADPDVIMIGEMRDHETAHIGVEASLTGHLVFSTLHTNSAPETITRLLDMGLNPLNFSDAFQGVLAQRLVRRLCKKCRTTYTPSEEEFDDIVADYGTEAFAKTGIALTSDLVLYRSTGCEECSGSGYKGRLGIHEMLEGTKEIKRMIKKQADTEQLFAQAAREGMVTLKQDGILKIFKGLTDIREIRRVCAA